MKASFVQRLQKDFQANPKKAGILGLLSLVAVYFWAPMIFGGGSDEGKAIKPAVKVTAATTSDKENAKEQFTPPPWRNVISGIDADARYRNPGVSLRRDPFTVTVPPAPKAVAEPKVVKVEVNVTPQSAKISLSSTVVGKDRKVALINGRYYHEGERVSGETGKTKVNFTLAEIHPRRVVLEREGKKFELKIRQTSLSQFVQSGETEPD